MVTVFMVSSVFGSAAAFELTALGGAPITPAVFALPFLLLWALKQNGFEGLVQSLRFPSPGSWLLLLTLWGLISAILLPRYFAGETYVFNVSRGDGPLGVPLVLLAPSSTNITQSCYLVSNLAAFAAMRSILVKDGKLERFGKAVILMASVNTAFAILGLVEDYAKIPIGISFFKNANYAIASTGEINGIIRIVGTFAEASSFAGFTAPLFVCLVSLWRNRFRPRVTGPLAFASLLLLAFSTSSTAYGTLLVYGLGVSICFAFRLLVPNNSFRLGAPALIVWATLVMGCLLVLIKPELYEKIRIFFEVTVVNKMDSSSGAERGSWNSQAWLAFLDTYGMGAGLGSARASNTLLVIMSNMGALGVILFGGFLVGIFRCSFPSHEKEEQVVATAAGHAVLVCLISGMFSATVFDMGTAFYGFAAAAATACSGLRSDPRSPFRKRVFNG